MSPGENVAIKLDSYPQQTWRGRVSVVSPEAKAGDGERTFTVEVPLSNADARLAHRNDRPGEDFPGLETGRICTAAASGPVGLADTLELDWVVNRMTNASALPCSLVLRGRHHDCCNHISLRAAAILTRSRRTRARRQSASVPAAKGRAGDYALVAEAADPKSFTTTGPLVAEQQADIAAERNGRIVSIDVRIGDRVKKGQLLARARRSLVAVRMRFAEGAEWHRRRRSFASGRPSN